MMVLINDDDISKGGVVVVVRRGLRGSAPMHHSHVSLSYERFLCLVRGFYRRSFDRAPVLSYSRTRGGGRECGILDRQKHIYRGTYRVSPIG